MGTAPYDEIGERLALFGLPLRSTGADCPDEGEEYRSFADDSPSAPASAAPYPSLERPRIPALPFVEDDTGAIGALVDILTDACYHVTCAERGWVRPTR